MIEKEEFWTPWDKPGMNLAMLNKELNHDIFCFKNLGNARIKYNKRNNDLREIEYTLKVYINIKSLQKQELRNRN